MAWSTVRSTLILIVDGATPTTKTSGVGDSIKHNAEANPYADPIRTGPPRSYSLFVLDDRIVRGLAGTRHRRAEVELVVFYKMLRDLPALDLILRADHAVIGDRLATPSLWVQSTSGISIIEPGSGEDFVPAVVDIRGPDVLHRYRFSVVYRS